MSASREKKKRQNQPEVITAEAPKKTMNKCLKRTLTIVIAIVLVAAIVFLGMVSSGFFQKNLTAAVINGHKLTPAMMNYFYVTAYSNLQSTMQFDTETPLDEQEAYGQNLGEYVMDYTVDSASSIYAMYDEALANGFELTEEDQASIDSEMQMLDLYAQMYGFSDGSAMLVSQYGVGSTKESYREYLTITHTTTAYATQIQEGFAYTQDDLDAYYEENKDSFNSATFRQFSVTPEVIGLADDPDALEACENSAKNIAEAGEVSEEAFLEAIVSALPEAEAASYDAETTTLRESVAFASLADAYKEWLSDESRQEGDTTYVENGEVGYIALYFISHDDYDFQMPNVRHILISASDTSDEAAMADAKVEAESILETYLAGEQTEDAFAALAQEHSADNAEDGGLYENITPGSMVEAFDAWCYDEARQVGDTGIVETEYGYHIMYFSGYGDTYLNYLLEEDMRYADYQAWYEEVTADTECTVNEGAKRWMVEL